MRKTSLKCVDLLARKDDRVVFVGSDLGYGVLDEMKVDMPSRFFMEGVSEQYIIGMASGLAIEGFIPYVNTIATFITRRCFEQVALDVCLHNLPVRLIGNGGGAVYAPLGPTHIAVEDLAIMRALPNMTVIAPCDSWEIMHLMNATLDWPHPIYLRLAKGGDKIVSEKNTCFEIGKAYIIEQPGDGLFVTTGVMAQEALEACKMLSQEGIDCGVLHVHTVKPLDTDALRLWIPRAQVVVTAEEHSRIGGLGSAILEFCSDEMPDQLHKIRRVGSPDAFSDQYGSQESLLAHWKINSIHLAASMRTLLSKRSQCT